MAQAIIEDTGKDIGVFMKDFTVEYIKALITFKLQGAMDEAVEVVFPSGLLEAAGVGSEEEEEDNGGDDVVEQKEDEEKDDTPPLASGVALAGYVLGTGPDSVPHRYYNLACFAIKEQDSVITKVVKRHGQLTKFHSDFKKQFASCPKDFPKKKLMGKNVEYYRERYNAMNNFFTQINTINEITDSNEFQLYFNLKYDADKAERMEIFMMAVESFCDSNGINFSYAQRKAERLGFDLEEVEMLKVIAVEKVGRNASRKLRHELNANLPGFVPGALKGKFENKTFQKLAGVIASGVEAGWDAAKEAFTAIVDKIREVLDKGMDPVKELFNKAMEPIGKVIKEKFSQVEEKLDANDGLGSDLNSNRFPPLLSSIDSIIANGGAEDAVNGLVNNINEMNECYKFAGYLMYNLGDPEIGKYIPFLNEIQDNHYRLVVGLTDLCFLLARACTRAIKPLAHYCDEIANNGPSDEAKHKEELKRYLKLAGASLAMDYYDLPMQARRMTWWLPSSVTNRFVLIGQTTICQFADILGKIGTNWKPTSKDDSRTTFGNLLKEHINPFINNRINLWITVVRRGTEAVIAKQFMDTIGSTIEEICGTLDELCSNLPDPLGENLKPGSIVWYLFDKMIQNCIIKGVELLAKKTEQIMLDPNAFAEPADESFVRRLRWAPRIKPDNFDYSNPDEGEDEDNEDGGDDDNKDKDNNNNENGDAPKVNKQLTQENTPDSDDENAQPKADA